MKRWQNNIPEYLISPLTTGFRKISIGVVKDRCFNQGMKKIIALLWITFLLPAWADDCPQWNQDEATENISVLSDEVAYHNELYFNQNVPIISDGEYDALVEKLTVWQECFPSIETEKSSLQTPHNQYTIHHQARMGSLMKAQSEEEIKRFLQQLSGSGVLVQPKIDGVAVELVYKNGQLIQASTRGNGEMGVDILRHIQQMPLIPKTLSPPMNNEKNELVLHGELFARFDHITPSILEQYASARHLVAGQLNRAEPETEAVKAFDFFPWQWINSPFISDFLSIKSLADMGFPLPLEHTHRTASYPEIKQHLEHYATVKKPLFLMDGIVIKADSNTLRNKLGWTGNTPAWAMAWKFPPETTTSGVQAIEFTIGRTGHITPVVHIKPVMIKNRTISTISLGSVQNLEKKGLAVGDQISIKLKGNAIPVFGKVLFRPKNRAIPELPDTSRYTPFTCLTIAPGCEKQFAARLIWLTGKQGLDLAAINKPFIHQWVQAGIIQTPVEVLKLKAPSLQDAGMQQQEIQQYLDSIQRPKSLEQQIRALSIPGIGKSTARELAGCITDLRGLLSRQLSGQCPTIGSKRMEDLQDYVNRKEVRELIEFLESSVPTHSVGT
ncbi:DNA ligase LigA-related protein [Endozoicomonas atrinae]|uniref:DNA ligase LigA-related protein n=1 Tax=Endozoicomonas atrinae TaxID=1333660 RepID=UPI003B00FCD4